MGSTSIAAEVYSAVVNVTGYVGLRVRYIHLRKACLNLAASVSEATGTGDDCGDKHLQPGIDSR